MSFSIGTFANDVAERSISTGWQAGLGFAIAADVLHNPGLAAVVAGALSVAKSLAVEFYRHSPDVQKMVKDVEKDAAPIINDAVAEVVTADAQNTAVAHTP